MSSPRFFLLSVVVLMVVLLGGLTWSISRLESVRDDRQKENEEFARTEGYAAALVDVSIVIAQGGGIDEVLDFAKRKSDAGFHDVNNLISTNFVIMESSYGRQSNVP